jgi:hypothetical protein
VEFSLIHLLLYQGTLPTQRDGCGYEQREAWLEYGEMCNSVACSWADWAVLAMFVAMMAFIFWQAFTNPQLRQKPPNNGRDRWL